MSIIDEKLAKAFLKDPKSVDLFKATEITDTAAEILAGYEGDLDLSGQTSLSDARRRVPVQTQWESLPIRPDRSY